MKIHRAYDEWLNERAVYYCRGPHSHITKVFVDIAEIPYCPGISSHERLHEISFITDMETNRWLDVLETVILDKNS